MSNSLRPHELQHARPPGPSPSPEVHPNSCPSSRWCHPVISSSVVPFSSCPQSLPASESFPMSQLFAWGGQSTEVSALASFLPKKSQGWSPSEWTGWISLQSKGLSSVFSNTTVQKHLHCCPANRLISSIFLDSIYMHKYTMIVFLFLTSLCKIGSSLSTSLELMQMHSFYGWVVFHCIHVPQPLYPFICWWTSGLLQCPSFVNSATKNSGTTEEPGRLWSMGSQRVRHNWAIRILTYLGLLKQSTPGWVT